MARIVRSQASVTSSLENPNVRNHFSISAYSASAGFLELKPIAFITEKISRENPRETSRASLHRADLPFMPAQRHLLGVPEAGVAVLHTILNQIFQKLG